MKNTTKCPVCLKVLKKANQAAYPADETAIKEGKGPVYAVCKKCIGPSVTTVCSSKNRPRMSDER